MNGQDIECTDFTIADDVKVYHSCAITYQNQFFVYGGQMLKSFSRQIAKVTNKSLKRVGDLPFDFIRGGCSSTTDKILLCFSEQSDWRTCYKSTNPIAQFLERKKSKHIHLRIKFASSECKFFQKFRF